MISLTSRRANWYKLLKVIEESGKTTIKNQDDFFNNLDESEDASYKYIKEQSMRKCIVGLCLQDKPASFYCLL